MTRPAPRTLRAARVLAALLVPLIALPALGGLVVCTTAGGVATSWGERPCPKRQAATPLASADGATGAPCVVVPDADAAPVVAAPDLRGPAPIAWAVAEGVVQRPAEAPVVRPSGPRGPPSGALRALRSTVLRV